MGDTVRCLDSSQPCSGGLPSGATQILQVGDEEKFKSRIMSDAPETGEKVTEQLLDGQQRLTALRRSLHDHYPDRTYLIRFEEDPDQEGTSLPYVYGQARWSKNGIRYPQWVDNPQECWAREFIPVRLLAPHDNKDTIDGWIEEAISGNGVVQFQAYKDLSNIFSEMKLRVREFNFPYLA